MKNLSNILLEVVLFDFLMGGDAVTLFDCTKAITNKLSATGESKKQKEEFARQYKKYLELGFTQRTSQHCIKHNLVLYKAMPQILSNNAVKPFKLSHHFHSKNNKQNYIFQKLL